MSSFIFHKHSPYEPTRLGFLSPPDTGSEFEPPSQIPISRPISATLRELNHTLSQPSQAETPIMRPGRVSTLTYHHSGPRESQERTTYKNSKSLVVIIPPKSFSQEHGQLGHTLSSGPQNRLSHGILMPLFPTMYAQLTAIAREFNFPSTLGLCLYLQISDGGISATPRISDDSWQLLWGHLLDGNNPVTRLQGLPISGKIEFDIDLNKARWYKSWISASRRDAMLSHTPSISHSRDDSRTLLVDDQVNDEQQNNPLSTQSNQNTFRHIPKKLSLLSKSASQSGTISPEALDTQIISALPPIMQGDEPPTAKQELETKVNTWRANTSLTSTHMTPSSGPKTVSLVDLPIIPAEHSSPELNLDDFSWSISSAGPPSERVDSPLSCEHLSSIHLDRRVESVCLTPSVCTSFGPFDYDLHSPMTDVSRVPSIDIAQRMVDDCPPTPTTATDWGAPLSYPPSPLSEYRPPSIHLDLRGEFSRPVTPVTATSWGAPTSWPATPLSDYRAPSVDIGERGGWSRPATPLTATTWGPLMSYPPTPIIPFHVHTPDVGMCAFDSYDITSTGVWGYVWPYRRHQSCIDSTSVTPRKEKTDQFQDLTSISNYPHLKIYPNVYPHYDLYPAVAASELEDMLDKSLPTTLQGAYPVLNIYPACYPHFDIYPTMHPWGNDIAVKSAVTEPKSHPVKIKPLSCSGYPDFNLYPVVSPSLAVEEVAPCFSVRLAVEYPYFDLYPSVYPFVAPYPSCDSSTLASKWPKCNIDTLEVKPIQKSLSVVIETNYPYFNIYPVVYPAFEIYPNIETLHVISLDKTSSMFSSPSRDCSGSNLDIHPETSQTEEDPSTKIAHDTHTGVLRYPVFNIYPAVYPYLEPYPPWWADAQPSTTQME